MINFTEDSHLMLRHWELNTIEYWTTALTQLLGQIKEKRDKKKKRKEIMTLAPLR